MIELYFFRCPQKNSDTFFRLFLIGLASSILLVANPGFFSHDEYQKLDHVLRFGFQNYWSAYVNFYQGTEFGQPVRPFSFLIQGLAAFFIPTYPVVVHLFDVFSHVLVATILFFVILEFTPNRQYAWISAIVFILSPLATFSVGWSAALMDRFYIFFGLLGFLSASKYIAGKIGGWGIAGVCVASIFAISSKETAMVLPGTLFLFFFFQPISATSKRRLATIFIAWILPLLIFLLYRLPALMGSLAVPKSTGYAISSSNLIEGIFVYWFYPFLPLLPEIHIWKLMGNWWIGLSCALHFVFLFLLYCKFGLKAVGLYLFGYMIFLAPVLLIPTRGAHYLYGSGIAFSLAAAALFSSWKQYGILSKVALTGMTSVAIAHAAINQFFIYDVGSCMETASTSLESAYLSGGRPHIMNIAIDEGARGYILHRLTAGRTQVGAYFPVEFRIEETVGIADDAIYSFNKQCIVYKK